MRFSPAQGQVNHSSLCDTPAYCQLTLSVVFNASENVFFTPRRQNEGDELIRRLEPLELSEAVERLERNEVLERWLIFSEERCEPGLLFPWQAGRAVVMSDLRKSGCGHDVAPAAEVIEHTVSAAAPAFFVVTSRVRAEQNALQLPGGVNLFQKAGPFLAWAE